MKRIFLITLLTLLSFSTVRAQDAQMLLGPLTVAELIELPGWFGEDFMTYQPVRQYVERIPEFLEDVEIVCVLGTWCSDSRREVPRMIRILQSQNLPPEKMRMIGVDQRKRDPDGETAAFDIERVPTFIFLRDGVEIGRIVESPLASLEKDMLGIIDPNAGQGGGPAPDVIIIDGDGTEHHLSPDHEELERLRTEEQTQKADGDDHPVEKEYHVK
ncbi:MAG: thioredoxin family protein [Bacteroidetes bacterium]|nr:thioredoxin family protein [Bacteroidota bacterium]